MPIRLKLWINEIRSHESKLEFVGGELNREEGKIEESALNDKWLESLA